MATILAIESSCDETAVAILKDKKELLANVISSQIDTHQLYGGVVPEIASRMHVQNISYVLKEALQKANITMEQVDAIAVTRGPGLVGSLHIGMQCAKTLALAYDKPLIGVHHIAGHIYANELVTPMQFPLIALVVSGGHTELVYMKDHLDFKIIGSTLDDAIGEAYDKVGRVINVPYPGGPQIDKLSKLGKPIYTLPKPKDDHSFDFSFSGLKSAVINLVHQYKQQNKMVDNASLACSFQEAALGIVVEKTKRALEHYGVKQLVVAGGVSANSKLRADLTSMTTSLGVRLTLPPLGYCTDNAAMIAMAGSYMYENNRIDQLDLSVKPNIEL